MPKPIPTMEVTSTYIQIGVLAVKRHIHSKANVTMAYPKINNPRYFFVFASMNPMGTPIKATNVLNGVNIEPLMVGLTFITSCTKIGEYPAMATVPKNESKPAIAAVRKVRLKSTCGSRMGDSARFSIWMKTIHATNEMMS